MDIVKKNLTSFIFAGVALIAVVAVFVFPIPGMYEEFHKDTGESNNILSKLNAVHSEPANLRNADIPPLNRVPNQKVKEWAEKKAEELKAALKDTQEKVLAIANQSQHKLLLPRDPAVWQRSAPFPSAYEAQVRVIFKSLAPEGVTSVPVQGKLAEKLKAGVPPTEAEMGVEDAPRAPAGGGGGIAPAPDGRAGPGAKQRAQEEAADAVRLAFAKRLNIYVSPNYVNFTNPDHNYSPNGGLQIASEILKYHSEHNPLNVYEMWWCYVNYWVQEDLVNSIVAANTAGYEALKLPEADRNVLNSTVKRLVAIQIDEGYTTTKGVFKPKPEAKAVPSPDGGVTDTTPMLVDVSPKTLSPAERVSNDIFDVIQFTLTVDIDATRIDSFLAELARGGRFNVLAVKQVSVDRAVARNVGLIYGDKPVVQLSLWCEAIQLRGWTVPLMPDEVKKAMNIQSPPPAQ